MKWKYWFKNASENEHFEELFSTLVDSALTEMHCPIAYFSSPKLIIN